MTLVDSVGPRLPAHAAAQTMRGGWTDERLEELKSRWAKGESAGQIAIAICEGQFRPSRNAIIGKLHRLGLHGRDRVTRNRRVRAAGIMPAPKRRQRIFISNHPMPRVYQGDVSELPPQNDGSLIPFEQRRTLMTVEAHHCRWPFGEPDSPDFFFCGATNVGTLSYCAGHARAAYQPGKPWYERVKNPRYSPFYP